MANTENEVEYIIENGMLKEIQPIVPTERTFELFSIETIDEQISQYTVSLQQAQENLDLWISRRKKAEELELVTPVVEDDNSNNETPQ